MTAALTPTDLIALYATCAAILLGGGGLLWLRKHWAWLMHSPSEAEKLQARKAARRAIWRAAHERRGFVPFEVELGPYDTEHTDNRAYERAARRVQETRKAELRAWIDRWNKGPASTENPAARKKQEREDYEREVRRWD